MDDLSHIRPGDILLYDRGGWFGWAIKIKTWSKVSHCEVAISHDRAAASRNGIGCGIYRRDLRGLAAVVRPDASFDETRALDWFARERIDEQGYDWLGLLSFYIASYQGRENGKMFCSEFVRRFLREGGCEMFRPDVDSDCIAPSEFLKSPNGRLIWTNGQVK